MKFLYVIFGGLTTLLIAQSSSLTFLHCILIGGWWLWGLKNLGSAKVVFKPWRTYLQKISGRFKIAHLIVKAILQLIRSQKPDGESDSDSEGMSDFDSGRDKREDSSD